MHPQLSFRIVVALTCLLLLNLTAPQSASADGDCDPFQGSQDGNVCCAASCGTCGAPNCESLTGGEDNCCRNEIIESKDFCAEVNQAPCILADVSDINVNLSTDGRSLVLSTNISRRSEFTICNGNITIGSGSMEVVFFRLEDGLEFGNHRIEIQLKPSGPCNNALFGQKVCSSEQSPPSPPEGFAPSLVDGAMLALFDDNLQPSEENCFCYRILALNGEECLVTDPRIYNSQPGGAQEDCVDD